MSAWGKLFARAEAQKDARLMMPRSLVEDLPADVFVGGEAGREAFIGYWDKHNWWAIESRGGVYIGETSIDISTITRDVARGPME